MAFKKECIECDEMFETEQKYSKLCPKCKEKNHQTKIKRTLHLI